MSNTSSTPVSGAKTDNLLLNILMLVNGFVLTLKQAHETFTEQWPLRPQVAVIS